MHTYLAIMTVEDDAITFTIPNLSGFAAQVDGTDISAAIDEARQVLADFCGVWIEQGHELPRPWTHEELMESPMAPFGHSNEAIVALKAQPIGGEPVRVNISLDSLTLAEIDKAAKARGLTRSAYLALAARELESA